MSTKQLTDLFARTRKAFMAAGAAGVTAFTASVAKGSLTQQDWYYIVGAVVVTFGLVWLVPNRPAP